MDPLQPPSSFHASSAEGWIALGNLEEARDELSKIEPEASEHSQVLDVWWQLHTKEKNWNHAFKVARNMVTRYPDNPAGWIYRSYAARRVANAGIATARDLLLPAAASFPDEPVIPFNLACYECLLGNLDEARAYLKIAINLGDHRSIKKMARDESDLEPLWTELSKF